MISIKGKYNEAKVFTDNVDEKAISQIITLCNQDYMEGLKIRIMSDCHAGAGCTIGFTSTLGNKIVPNLIGVDIGCVDKDTEYLTTNGWKKISEYDGEAVATYDLSTNSTRFITPLAYIRLPETQFYHLKTKYGVDQMLSSEHTCLVEKGSHNRPCSRGQRYILSAEDLYQKHNRLVLGFRDNFITEIPNLDISKRCDLTDEQIRIQVMIMADGHLEGKVSCVLKLKKERKIVRAKALLESAGISYTENPQSNNATSIRFNAPVMEKRISYFYNASKEQLSIICDELKHWDYAIDTDVFISKYKSDVDFVQYAFATQGVRTSINHDTRDNKESYRCIISGGPARVQIAGTPKTPIHIVPSEDGLKYCFTTSTGFWIMRRNGCIAITGNCGMLVAKLKDSDINLDNLDRIINEKVPSGHSVNQNCIQKFDYERLECIKHLDNLRRIENSIGSLGGGNHFIELNKDDKGNKYLVIHSGSRNLGKQVAEYYQDLAVKNIKNDKQYKSNVELIVSKSESKDIQSKLESLKKEHLSNKKNYPKDLCYLEGSDMDSYLNDVSVCQEYASVNRKTIANTILKNLFNKSINDFECFETIHNYIDLNSNVIRKGAVSSQKGEELIIPINMRDGSLICIGKGNEDWNYSAPHGAGRIMSRGQAKENISLEEYKESMDGIYSSSVNNSTIDEAPMAYKPIEEILSNTGDTIDVVDIIKPIYNYKSSN